MKKIEDYLHLYLGCEVQVKYKEHFLEAAEKQEFDKNLIEKHFDEYKVEKITALTLIQYHSKNLKPILRELSSMTEEEKQVIANMAAIYTNHQEYNLPSFEKSKRRAADQTRYLLKQGFDLFGLIESGLAIASPNPINEHSLVNTTKGGKSV